MRKSQKSQFFDKLSYPESSPSGAIKRRSVRGAVATSISQIVSLALRFTATGILARLLLPEDYGLVAMTAVWVAFLAIFKDGGLSWSTIQRSNITHQEVSTLFWMNLVIGLFLAALLIICSPLISSFYREPRLALVAPAMAVNFVFGGLAVQHRAILNRQMRFSVLAWIEISSISIGIAVAITLATMGAGYWALVAMTNATVLANTVAVWMVVKWRPGLPAFDHTALPHLKFGADILGFNVVNFVSRQADNVLIGWRWGAVALGLYDKAYTLLLMPLSQINSPISAVMVPMLSRAKPEAEAFKRFFLGAMEIVACCSIPIILAIALFANEVVLLWLGAKWVESATLFRYLAAAALAGALSNPIGWFLISRGLTRRYRQLGIVSAVILLTAFLIGLPNGAEGVALAYSTAMVFIFLPAWMWALHGTGLSVREVLATFAPASTAGALAAASAFLVKSMSPSTLVWKALFEIATFGIVYATVLLFVFMKWTRLTALLRDSFGSSTNEEEGLTCEVARL